MRYSVAMRAELAPPYFVRLTEVTKVAMPLAAVS
jgi:hypothetical protein